MLPYVPATTARRLAVIDFRDAAAADLSKRRAVADLIRETCREIGFFYLANHDVPEALVTGQFEWARRFFDLPQHEKDAIHMSSSRSGYGYEPLAAQVLDEGSPPDIKEGFQIGFEPPPGHPYLERGLPRYGHNQWPGSLDGFTQHSRRYYDAMRTLSHRLLASIALSLELPEEFFEPALAVPIATLRMLHYPLQPHDPAPNQMGAGAHTDWGLVTILAQDRSGGLEVQDSTGQWVRAEPIDGTFVINIGDLLQRWSNDMYQSNPHRVHLLHGINASRYSLPFFQDGDQVTFVECLPTCVNENRPARYAPCTIGDYMNSKIQRTYRRGVLPTAPEDNVDPVPR